MDFYKKVKNYLSSKNDKTNPVILKHFLKIKQNFPLFEFRPLQIEFAYLAVKNALSKNPVALSLGCGEGKQEGFAVAMKTYEELNKDSKILFLTPTKELLLQMKNSPLLKDEDINICLENKPLKKGINLCEYNVFLYNALLKKLNLPNMLEEVDVIFADEFHYFLTSPDYIITLDSPKNQKEKITIFSQIKAKKALLEIVREEFLKDKTLIIHSSQRHTSQINPKKILKLLDKTPKHLLNKLNLTPVSFVDEVNTIATALVKEAAKDYYLFGEEEITSYCCSDIKSAKPSFNTTFENKNLSLYIALKHITPDIHKEKETEFLIDLYSEKYLAKITPLEAVKLIGNNKFTAASATLEYVDNELKSLNFKTVKLQNELKLSLKDKDVSVFINEDFFMFDEYHQILITSNSAVKLKELFNKFSNRPEYTTHLITYDEKNPDIEKFNKSLENIKSLIQKNPLKKRILLIQGIAEGTNIFKKTDTRYKALVIKLDIAPIDTVTQTRYRIGTKGRAKGGFIHSVDFSFSHSDILTSNELNKLKSSPTPQTLIDIEKNIKPPKTAYKIKRRDFIKKIASVALLTSFAPNAIVDLVNKATHEQVLYKSTARASDKKWYSEFPPGIQIGTKRDYMIGNAYAEYKKYHDRGRALAMLRIKDRPVTKRVRKETIYVSPAYWYMIAEIHYSGCCDWPRGINYDKFKKNKPLYYFEGGIWLYFSYWRGSNNVSFYDVEKNFIYSIYTAAGFTEKDADKYLNNENLEFRKKEIEKVYNALASLKGAKPYSMDPNNAWNKQLTAEWAATWLANHYWNKLSSKFYRKLSYTINGYLEKPLRKYIPKIRGPPYYSEKGN